MSNELKITYGKSGGGMSFCSKEKMAEQILNENKVKVFDSKNEHININGTILGKSTGKGYKTKNIPIEKFDISIAPDKIDITKFKDKQGNILIIMGYEV